MFIPLKRKASPTQEPDAVDLLLECHERIRRFTRLSTWLCDAHDAPELAVKETADSILRYFTEALPKHRADEELSIAPRLSTGRFPAELAAAAATMTKQHTDIEATIDALCPLWRAVSEDPAALAEHAPAMERLVQRARGLWDPHLHLEETLVFPAVRARLSAPERAAVLREMRERRR